MSILRLISYDDLIDQYIKFVRTETTTKTRKKKRHVHYRSSVKFVIGFMRVDEFFTISCDDHVKY